MGTATPQPCSTPPQSKLAAWGEACTFGDLDIVRLLAGVGSDVTAADNQQQTPLHLASQEGHAAVARLLLAREPMRRRPD